MKYLFCILFYFLVLTSFNVNGQSPMRLDSGENLFNYKARMQVYFDSIRPLTDSSEFYSEGGEYNEYRRFLIFWEPRLSVDGDFSKYDEAKYTYYTSTINNILQINDDPWSEIGPKVKPDNMGSNFAGVGPINFLTFFDNGTNTYTNHMLAGSCAGGLFYSTDHGEHWSNAGTDTQWPTSGCGFAVFDPDDYNIWYASSSNYVQGYGKIGKTGGIFRTVDEGVNWTQIAYYNTQIANYPGTYFGTETIIYKLIIDPDNNNVLFAATSSGIYKTTNCGSIMAPPTWNKKLDGFIYDIEMNPDNSNKLYATVCTGTLWKIMISNDAGETWNDMLSQPDILTVTSTNPRSNSMTIEVSKARPAYLYCIVKTKDTTHDYSKGQIYYYDFNYPALNWTSVGSDFYVMMGGGHGFGVDQAGNGNEVYYACCGGAAGIYAKKIDITVGAATSVALSHVDVEDIVCHPYNVGEVWIANHGGLDKSTDSCSSTEIKVDGLGVSQTWRMAASYSSPDYVAIGCYHDCTNITNSQYEENWNPSWINDLSGMDGQRPLIDNKNPKYMWTSGQGDVGWSQWFLSDDYGESFPYSEKPQYYPSDWCTEGVLNKVEPSTFYRFWEDAGTTKIMRSFERGKTGTNECISNNINTLNFGSEYFIYQLFTPYTNGDYLYAYLLGKSLSESTNHWHLIRTKNVNDVANNVNWEELWIPRYYNCWFSSLRFDNYNPDIIYLVYSSSENETAWPSAKNMIYKIDYSSSISIPNWTDLTNNLPYTYCSEGGNGIAIEKGSDGGIYLSTDFGVFYTNNKLITSGIGWTVFGTELPHVVGQGIEINYKINKIRIGTYGRGVWEHSLYCPPDIDFYETVTYTQNTFLEAQNDITSTATVNPDLTVNYRAGHQINLLPGFSAIEGSTFHAFIHKCNEPGNSFKINENSNDSYINVENNAENGFTVMPNPSDGNFSVAYEIPENTIGTFEVYNIIGEKLFSYELFSGKNTFSISRSELNQGIYFYRATAGNKQIAADKIVVIK